MPDFTGNIATADQVDEYTVSLTAGVQYFVEVQGDATENGTLGDPLVLVTLGAAEVDTDDDGGLGLNARSVFTAATSGLYTISVSGVSGSLGTYLLRANPDDFRDTEDGNGDAGVVGNRQPAQTGTINFGADHDAFATDLIAGLTYAFYERGQADAHGTLVDPLLSLTDGSGFEYARNDDANGTFDSFFEYTPDSSGTYWLLAGAVGSGTGTYDVLEGAGRGNNFGNFIVGTASSDNVNGLGGDDIIDGGRGLDRLMGGNGNDTIDGGGGGDLMIGGAGNDRYFVDNPNDIVVEAAGEGTDTMFVSVGEVPIPIAGNVENATVIGVEGAEIEGNALDNTIRGSDLGSGSFGYLAGGFGDDWIYGGTGDDFIEGDSGDDRLVGGAGADTFFFVATDDPLFDVKGDRDTIYAFETGVDKIWVIFDDVDTTYIANAAFTGTAGQVRYDGSSVTGDANGDRVADFQIVISNHAPLTADDFDLGLLMM